MLKERYDTEPSEMDTRVFDTLVPPDHYLRRVKRLIDFERWRDLITDGYSPAMGRTAEDPMRLIKLAFVQFHDNLSDREVMAAAQVNVAVRDVLDLSLASRLPVPSVLAQFRTRLGAQRHQALFDQVVTPARAYGLIRDRRRLKDATHVLANIAVPSTLRLVAQTRQRWLDAARPYAPAPGATDAAEAEVVRQATADLPDTDRLVARVTHLRAIVTWADAVQQALGPLPVSPDRGRTRFEAALALAHRVLADRDDPDTGDQVQSVVDPDARYGTHGAYFDAYLLDISLDAGSEWLTALNLLPGIGDEVRDAQTRLEVCLCPAPVCGVSPASAVPDHAAPKEGTECNQAMTRPHTTRRGPGPRRPAMRPCVSNIPGSNASWPRSCDTTTGAAVGTGANGG